MLRGNTFQNWSCWAVKKPLAFQFSRSWSATLVVTSFTITSSALCSTTFTGSRHVVDALVPDPTPRISWVWIPNWHNSTKIFLWKMDDWIEPTCGVRRSTHLTRSCAQVSSGWILHTSQVTRKSISSSMLSLLSLRTDGSCSHFIVWMPRLENGIITLNWLVFLSQLRMLEITTWCWIETEKFSNLLDAFGLIIADCYSYHVFIDSGLFAVVQQSFKDRKWLGYIDYSHGRMRLRQPKRPDCADAPLNFEDCLQKAQDIFQRYVLIIA